MKGIIISIDSKQSNVYSEGQTYLCEAKGNLKKDTKILIGDNVIFSILDKSKMHGIIEKIEPRKNELYRPKIANVDQVVIITAVKKPTLATYILNKYLAMLEVKNIEPILVFTKIDLLTNEDEEIFNKIDEYEKIGYQVIKINNIVSNKLELDKLKKILENKISVFTGQTGAGKSTTLNNFLEIKYHIKTQEISDSLNRGKHTTTNVRLYSLDNGVLIADTPGFSSFDLKNISVDDLIYGIKIFKPYLNKCKFDNCKHINEKNCAVKQAVEENLIPKFIYEDYKKIYSELTSIRKDWK